MSGLRDWIVKWIHNQSNDPVQGVLVNESMSACRKSLIAGPMLLALDILIQDMMMGESWMPASLWHSCTDVHRAGALGQTLLWAP